MEPPPRTRAGIMTDWTQTAMLSCIVRAATNNLALCPAPNISRSSGSRAVFAPRSTEVVMTRYHNENIALYES